MIKVLDGISSSAIFETRKLLVPSLFIPACLNVFVNLPLGF